MAIAYKFGWHPSTPDVRDTLYRLRAPVARVTALPPKFRLDEALTGGPWLPVFEQDVGDCGPNARAGNTLYDDITMPETGEVIKESRRFGYYTTRQIQGTVDYDSGVDNRSLFKALNTYGFCREETWPYSNDFKAKPSAAAYEEGSRNKAGIVYQSVPQKLEDMKSCLFDTKCPFVYGFMVYSSMLTPTVDSTGYVPYPTMLDRPEGGHDVLIVGWDDLLQVFIFRNSWGGGWGDHGFGYMPYKYALNPDLSSDFWTLVKAPALGGAPLPTPPTPLPIPVPPVPGGSTLKTIIDAIFAQILGQVGEPWKTIIKWVQSVVDAWLDAHPLFGAMSILRLQNQILGITGSEIKPLVDEIFALINAHTSNFVVKMALRLVQNVVDNWLDAHPGPLPIIG